MMEENTLTQHSFQPKDFPSPVHQLLGSVFLYGVYYYEVKEVKTWVMDVITHPSVLQRKQMYDVLNQLEDDLYRQTVYGPTACYVTPADLPHNSHLNNKLTYQQKHSNVGEVKAVIGELGLGELIGEERVEELLWYSRSSLMKIQQFIKPKVSKQVRQELEVDGEAWNSSASLPTLLLLLSSTYLRLSSLRPNFFNLKIARIHFLHNKLLNQPTSHLSHIVLTHYKQHINSLSHRGDLTITMYMSYLTQYINVLVFYYKYREAEQLLRFCKQLLHMSIQFTGKLGRRTKYQSFDTPQLVMDIKKKEPTQKKEVDQQEGEDEKLDLLPIKQLIMQQLSKSTDNQHIENIKYDEESILLDQPKLVEEQSPEKEELGLEKIIVIVCEMQYMWDTIPKDEILYQQISTSIGKVIDWCQTSYPIMFSVLLLRSLNEFPRIKHSDRAMEQLNKLKQQYNGQINKSTTNMFATAYYPYLEFVKVLANKYMDLSLSLSAVELFGEVGMVEECIDALISRSYKEKALELAEKQMKEGKTPRLLCMMGDLQNDSLDYYEEAWELSKHRFARAQRSIGWHYFRRREFEKAAEAFSLATKANHYHPNTWFTLGCSYMQVHNFEKAAGAFGECICIDDTQGEVWGNLAACYMNMKRMKEAYSTLQQAVKYSERNWKLWANMLTVSLVVKQFYKYIESIERIAESDHTQVITREHFEKLVKIFQYKQDTEQRKRGVFNIKRRIDRMYKLLTEKMGSRPLLWQAITNYNIQLLSYIKNLELHYTTLHKQNKIDVNDLVPGFETLEQTISISELCIKETFKNIIESKRTELQMTMIIGWEQNKIEGEKVRAVLMDYVRIWKKYGNKQQQELQEEVFIEGVRKKVEVCLETEIML